MFLNFFVQVLTVNGGAVKRGDVHFDNGIIHIVDKVLYPVVMEAQTGGISTGKVDALVEALGDASGVSKSEVSRNCQGHRRSAESLSGPAV